MSSSRELASAHRYKGGGLHDRFPNRMCSCTSKLPPFRTLSAANLRPHTVKKVGGLCDSFSHRVCEAGCLTIESLVTNNYSLEKIQPFTMLSAANLHLHTVKKVGGLHDRFSHRVYPILGAVPFKDYQPQTCIRTAIQRQGA